MSEDVTEIRMQSRPEPGAFGACYECADGIHERCLGVPCECACPFTDRTREAEPFLGRVHEVWETLAALTRLPDDSVDAVITDPPYSSGGFTRGDRNNDPAQKYASSDSPDGRGVGRISFSGDNRDGRSWAYWSALWMSECLRVLRPGGYMLTFTDWRMLPLATDALQAGGFVWRGLVAWDKGESARAPHTGYFRHQAEYVVWGTKGPLEPAKHGGPFPGVVRCSVRQDDKFHITGKPTEVMRQLVRVVPEGAIVLDPFAGSGTTVLGAMLENRRAFGFEREPENVRIANERIKAAQVGLQGREALEGQRPLFGGEAP